MTSQDKEQSLYFLNIAEQITDREGRKLSLVIIYIKGRIYQANWAEGFHGFETVEFPEVARG